MFNQARDLFSRFLGFSHNGQRNLYEQFGYRRVIFPVDYYAMYRRNDIASRIIKGYPQATWRDCPVIRDEASDDSKTSKFVDAFEKMNEDMRLQWYFERADKLSGLGHYSVLFLGFQDGQDFSTPVSGNPKLIYVSPYSEQNIIINTYELDVQNPRFGMPKLYTLQKGSPLAASRSQAIGKSLHVHWSRLIHIAETLDDDEVFGVPRLECVYNRLMDLEKIVGGSAETFWLNSRQGMSLMADKDANISDETLKDMKQQAMEFEHQLRRIIAMQGVEAKVLNAQVADPKGHVDVQLDLIAGATGYPKRILIGSERGELASTQDENNWSSRVDERRIHFATPSILKPFVNLMITTGNLPAPTGSWWTEWPELAAQSPGEKADIAVKKSEALKNYASAPGASLVVPEEEFRVWLGEEPVSEYDIAELPPINETNPAVKAQFAQNKKNRKKSNVEYIVRNKKRIIKVA